MKNKRVEKLIFGLWIILALSSVGFIGLVVGAWSARHAATDTGRFSKSQSGFILGLSTIPGKILTSVDASENLTTEDPLPLLLDKEVAEKPYWLRQFPSSEDDGYLLLSGVDPQYKHSNIRLIRISDGEVLQAWNPNWQYILTKVSEKKFASKPALGNMTPNHPLPLPNGEIIFLAGSGSQLVKMTPCKNQIEKVFDAFAHHSIELDNSNNIITGSVAEDYFVDNSFLRDNIRDDSILKLTLDGKIIENLSLSKMLIDNGSESLLFGHMGSGFEPDPIHLNQVSVAKSDGNFWLKGDYLISARNLSSIFLYRPSTNKIIWHQSGPWKNQHSAQFIDDHRIGLLDNNVYLAARGGEYSFANKSDVNRVFIVNFSTGNSQTSEPFKELLESEHAKPQTIYGGLIRVLPNGGLFIEETQYGRHLRFTKDRLLWSRINDYDETRVGLVSWSRYLTKVEGDEFWRQIQESKKSCPIN